MTPSCHGYSASFMTHMCLYHQNVSSELRDSVINQYLYIPITDHNIHEIVRLWFNSAREKRNQGYFLSLYGHMSYWDTGSITNMSNLFRNYPYSDTDTI